MDSSLYPAFLALAGVLVTGGIAVYNARRLQTFTREIQENKASHDLNLTRAQAEFDRRLTEVQNDLAHRRAVQDARRDYEYEALKRLYRESEPLLFQLAEAAENALYRIYSLARTACSGYLDPARPDGWLHSPNHYYTLSTAYYLLAPLAHARLLQQSLTGVDLELDQIIHLKYILAKRTLLSFTDDFTLAKVEPALPYDPEDGHKEGLYLGLLDYALNALITEKRQVMRYGEFEKAALQNGEFREAVAPFLDLLLKFHPAHKPVLWRILLAQAHIYLAFSRGLQPGPTDPIRLLPLSVEERQRLSWHSGPPSDEALPIDVAWAYLSQNLPGVLFETPVPRHGGYE